MLGKLDTFKYLGRMLSFNGSDCPEVAWNLHRARSKWGLVISYAVPRQGRHHITWAILCGNGAVCVSLWVVVVGFHTPHSAGAGQLP